MDCYQCFNWSVPVIYVVEAWVCFLTGFYSSHTASGPSRRTSGLLPMPSMLLTRSVNTKRSMVLDWPKEGNKESGVGLLICPLSTSKLQSQVLQVDADRQGDTNTLETSEGALEHRHANSTIRHFEFVLFFSFSFIAAMRDAMSSPYLPLYCPRQSRYYPGTPSPSSTHVAEYPGMLK